MLRAFLQFSFIGAWATLFHYLIMFSLVELFDFEAVLATSIGFGLSSLFNYAANYRYTFKSDKKHREAYSKFMLIALVGFCLNGLVVGVLVNAAGWHYLFAQVLATLSVLLWTFSGNYFWSFRQKQDALNTEPDAE